MDNNRVKELKQKVIGGYKVGFDEAYDLYNSDYDTLTQSADEIREHFMKDSFDLCTIISAKGGNCSEDCKFCAQSAHYNNNADVYPLLDEDTVLKDAKKQKDKGVDRYSLVTVGKRLTDDEVNAAAKICKKIVKDVNIDVCVSFGLLSYENFKKLKDAGVSRIHNNMESSGEYFPKVCSTHSYDEKIQAIKNAKKAGLDVCSGGIFGIGESLSDRINMALTLRELDIKSIPINVLNPIKNTPYENNPVLHKEEVNRIIAMYRFILPDAYIRTAGGRALLGDKGLSAFKSGANAAISGDMLTTHGIDTKSDIAMIRSIGFKANK